MNDTTQIERVTQIGNTELPHTPTQRELDQFWNDDPVPLGADPHANNPVDPQTVAVG